MGMGMVFRLRLTFNLALGFSLCLSCAQMPEKSGSSGALVPVAVFTTDAIFSQVAALAPVRRSQIFTAIGGMSPEEYYQWMAARVTMQPVSIDGQIYTDMGQRLKAFKEMIDALKGNAASMRQLWHQLGLDPGHASLAAMRKLLESSDSSSSLGLLAPLATEECDPMTAVFRKNFGVSAASLAAMWDQLPVDGPGVPEDQSISDPKPSRGAKNGVKLSVQLYGSQANVGLNYVNISSRSTSDVTRPNGFLRPKQAYFSSCFKQKPVSVLVHGPNPDDEKGYIMVATPEQTF